MFAMIERCAFEFLLLIKDLFVLRIFLGVELLVRGLKQGFEKVVKSKKQNM